MRSDSADAWQPGRGDDTNALQEPSRDATEGSHDSASADVGRFLDTRADRTEVTDLGRDVVRVDTDTASDARDDTSPRPFKGVANSRCTELELLGATWYYNWTRTPEEPNCRAPAQFVPMIWGHTGSEQTASRIAEAMAAMAQKGEPYVLGFNEPDNSTQANISVDRAIELWPAFTKTAVRVGSPATQANTSGQAWFKDFMARVNADTTGDLRVDFLAIHWYGWNAGSCDAKAATLESYIRSIEAIPGDRPIWITEWGCLNQSAPTTAAVEAFFAGAVAMFARHPRIERYAWYPWATNNALIGDRSANPPEPTALGKAFAAAPARR